MYKESMAPTIDEIPDDTVDLDIVYYHYTCVLTNFNKEDGVNRKEDRKYMEVDLDKADMEDATLGKLKGSSMEGCLLGQRRRNRRKKSLLHANRWDVYISEKIS